MSEESPLKGANAYTTGWMKVFDTTTSTEGGTFEPDMTVSLKHNHVYGAEAALDASAKASMQLTVFSHAETESDFYFPLPDQVNVRHLRLIHVTMRIVTPGVELVCLPDGYEGISAENRPYLVPRPAP